MKDGRQRIYFAKSPYYIHRHVDTEGTHLEEDIITYRHQWVWSDRVKVNGVIDAVVERTNQLSANSN